METLLIAVGAGVAFVIAYHTYGKWLGSKIFNLAADAVCPSQRLRDDKDYIPTAKPVVFGHHFTSIAGTGPIVGPAIAVMWGWVPALLWVVLGSIFIGAVHDLGSLVVSLRHNGQTVGDVAGRVLNRRVRLLFLLVLFMALTIVLAIFGLVIAVVFKYYPSSIFPCIIQIPIAIIIGLLLYRKGFGLLLPSLITLAIMYLSVYYGDVGFLHAFNEALKGWSVMTWVIVLLVYSYIASVLPVWLLLQPRDYINSLQLITALGLIVVGLTFAAFFGGAPVDGVRPELSIIAPAWDFKPSEAPLIFPFLFITIACGAISGFHCLVSSGTSSKQLKSESDAQFVGYGAMLTEGFLATVVILACVAGLGLGIKSGDATIIGADAWAARYATWSASNGLPAKVGAFVDGAANFLVAMGIKLTFAKALMGVLVASFAGTTLDTACRLQRYVVQELAATFASGNAVASGKTDDPLFTGEKTEASKFNPLAWLQNKHVATIFAIVLAVLMAIAPPAKAPVSLSQAWSGNIPAEVQLSPEVIEHLQAGGLAGVWQWVAAFGGKGGMILWPMFGATNQLLGGLAFLVISFYLWRRKKPVFFVIIPLLFMLVMPAWALLWQLFEQGVGQDTSWLDAEHRNWPLIFIAVATLLLEVWMIIEAILLWPKIKGILEPLPPGAATVVAGEA